MKIKKCTICGHEFNDVDLIYKTECWLTDVNEDRGTRQLSLTLCEDCYIEKLYPTILNIVGE